MSRTTSGTAMDAARCGASSDKVRAWSRVRIVSPRWRQVSRVAPGISHQNRSCRPDCRANDALANWHVADAEPLIVSDAEVVPQHPRLSVEQKMPSASYRIRRRTSTATCSTSCAPSRIREKRLTASGACRSTRRFLHACGRRPEPLRFWRRSKIRSLAPNTLALVDSKSMTPTNRFCTINGTTISASTLSTATMYL